MGRTRSPARMATREAQGWREARRLCCSKDSGFSERSAEENESKAQEVMPLCSSLPAASLLWSSLTRIYAMKCADAHGKPRHQTAGTGLFLRRLEFTAYCPRSRWGSTFGCTTVAR